MKHAAGTVARTVATTAAGTAVLLAVLAGCASRTPAPSNGAAGTDGNPGVGVNVSTGTGPGAATSAAPSNGSSNGPSRPGASGPAGGSSPTLLPPTNVGTSPAKPLPSSGDQVTYSSPDGVSVSADGKTLSMLVTWGGCADEPTIVVTVQDASKVVIELRKVTHFRLGAMCPDNVRESETSTVLGAALGSRQLVDGITHAEIKH